MSCANNVELLFITTDMDRQANRKLMTDQSLKIIDKLNYRL